MTLLLCIVITALGQSAQPTIRVEVKTDSSPVSDAVVMAADKSVSTGPNGTAVLPSSPGQIASDAKKDCFFPVHATVTVTAAQQAEVETELQPAKAEEEVTVYATRTNARLQDSPLHVEVVGSDEINEGLAMRPGDISMLLNEKGGTRVHTTSPGLGASSVRVQDDERSIHGVPHR